MSRLLRVLILSIISIGLFAAISTILPGIDAFEPIGKSLNDIAVTDIFYASTRDDEPVGNDKFLIIDTSDSDRAEIAGAVDCASSAGAAVIGVDIIFSDAAADSLATEALCDAMTRSRDLIVAAVHLNSWDEDSRSYVSTIATALDSLDLQFAYTNFITNSDNSYIRNYSVAATGLTPSFAQSVSDRYRRIYEDDNVVESTEEGIIDFTPQQFDVVDAEDIAAIDSLALGRIVLLGAVNSDEDYHYTPVGAMSGVVIQAYSVDTILNSATTVVPAWAVWLICVAVVLAAAFGFIVLRDGFERRNVVASRYTYAVLGLGNIVYPTLTILLTMFIIGLVYLTTLVYLPPLVIAGSLAFIPVAYDLMGIAKAIFVRRPMAAALVGICILFNAGNAEAQRTHDDYLKDIEWLNQNCPFDNSEISGPLAEKTAEALVNIYSNNELPLDDEIKTAIFECFKAAGYTIGDVVLASDYYLNDVKSPFLNEGVRLLSAGLQKLDSEESIGADWYRLALCYYFGLGTEVDYAKSRECIDKAYDITQNVTDDKRERYCYYNDGGALNILGSCLNAKGYPNKVCNKQRGSLTLYYGNNGWSYWSSGLIKDCEDALLAEDSEDLLNGFPNCKIEISPQNFIRFYPLIVKKQLPNEFLDICVSKAKTWQDNLLLGLIYCHYFDRKFQCFSFDNKLTGKTYMSGKSDGREDFVSCEFFIKANALFSLNNSNNYSEDERKYIVDFLIAYRFLTETHNTNDAIAGYRARQGLEAAVLSKILIDIKGLNFIKFFNRDHNEMIDYAASEGDLVAQYLLGYMYKVGNYVGFNQDTKKAREILSKWAGKDDMSFYFNSSVERFKYVADNLIRGGGIKNLDKIAAYEYSTLPQPIPAGKFGEKLMARATEIFIEKWMALNKEEVDKEVAQYVNKSNSDSSSSNKTKKSAKPKDPYAAAYQKISRQTDNEPAASGTKATKVSGTVYDIYGEPLIGASAIVVRSNAGSATDIDGRFEVMAKKGDRIDFSYIGHEPTSVIYDGKEIVVTLKEKNDKKATASRKNADASKTEKAPGKKQSQPQPQPQSQSKPKAQPQFQPQNNQPKTVNFAFRTPNNTKFSEPEFDLTFVTNSRTASYRITGSEPVDMPASALSSGKLRITLPKRDCELTVVDEANKMHFLSFIYDEAMSLRKSATLHILAIGINNYRAQNLDNLRFAEADAEAVADAFVKRHKYTFSNIRKTVLLGNKVTRQSIESEIERICDYAKPNDLAVIFFAGHGLVDSQKYFLATSEVEDAQRPNKGGLSATVFKDKIDYIPCKLVVFIDACHSAKVFSAFRSNDFFKELQSSRNGTDIYTSSGADERSREDSKFGHGIFTQALIEACDFENSDIDHDGRITIKEIRNYLERRIPELTSNQQNPDYRNIESSDYSIFIK